MRIGQIIRSWRIHEELTVRQVAARIGCLPSTLCRIEHGEQCDSRTLAAVLRWLMEEPAERRERKEQR